MEMKSPPPCPTTVRRNPPRKARATPSSAISLRKTPSTRTISSFPTHDITSIELPPNPNSTTTTTTADNNSIITSPSPLVENLKVYLRIRPLTVRKNSATSKTVAESKNAWPKNPKAKTSSRAVTKRNDEVCVLVNDDLHSVTVSTPQSMQETRRVKSEVYEGFSRVFASEATQMDVFEEMVKPLVDDFLEGKSGMLAAMGPSGSGKTHTVFGCARDPGMVPLALRRVFGENGSSGTRLSRVYYLSMLEISSERGKSERMIDLLHDGGDIFMHQSVVKGLQEAEVCDARQAESLIARGMLKRATATTNSNSQSSRSQCIINIRSASMNDDGEVDGEASTMLSIVDLAGAEKEKKTGNQGARLLESNFINNTSMVFGLCLRSLLEHQKNRSRQLQKHFQNSLLTRYMKDYLEGKKRMMLILTVKPGVEDYIDTSFVLRTASPFTKIKFRSIEEPVNLTCNKRPNYALSRAQQLKRMKFSDSDASLNGEGSVSKGSHLTSEDCKRIAEKVVEDGVHNLKTEEIGDENVMENLVLSDITVVSEITESLPLNGDIARNKTQDREYQILQGFSKSLWTTLKQYKKDLEVLKVENCHLQDSLKNEKSRSLDLENELTTEKQRVIDLENELKEHKYACRKSSTNTSSVSSLNVIPNPLRYQMAEWLEVNSEASSYHLKESDETGYEKKADHSDLEDLSVSTSDAQDVMGSKDTCTVDTCLRVQDLSVSNNDQQLGSTNDKGLVDLQSTGQLTNACLISSQDCERDAVKVVDEKNLEPVIGHTSNGSSCPTSLEYGSVDNSPDVEDLRDFKETLNQLQKFETDSDTNVDLDSRSQHLLLSTNDDEDCEVSSQATSECPSSSHINEQDNLEIVNDEKNWSFDTGSQLNGSSCRSSLESDSIVDSPDHEDIKDANRNLTQLQKDATGNENPIDSVADHSVAALMISVSPQKDGICFHVEEEESSKKDDKVINLHSKGRDVKALSETLRELSPNRSIQHTPKPKRRLLPASSVLLKDISIVDIKDENDKPKGARGAKKIVPVHDKTRTQGSLSLLHLLKKQTY